MSNVFILTIEATLTDLCTDWPDVEIDNVRLHNAPDHRRTAVKIEPMAYGRKL